MMGAAMKKKLYICDKKPGACSGWEKGWTKCENEMCFHTSNRKHRKYKGGRFIKLNGSTAKWQIMRRCNRINVFNKCEYEFDVKGCLCDECKKLPAKDNNKE